MKIIKKTILFIDGNPEAVGLLLSFMCLCFSITVGVTKPEIMQENHGWKTVGMILLIVASSPFCLFACGMITIFFYRIWARLVCWAGKE